MRASPSRLCRQVVPVGVHVLTEQGHFFHPLPRQPVHFADDLIQRAASLPAAAVGYNAVGAEVVAALHDGDEGAGGGVGWRYGVKAAFSLQPGWVCPRREEVVHLGEVSFQPVDIGVNQAAGDGDGQPRDFSSKLARRSDSALFIWQPMVQIWYWGMVV